MRKSRAYPFPYGFIIHTTAADGLNLDCFVITQQRLRTGQIVACEPIALMEQVDDGAEDHKVLARLANENVAVTSEIEAALVDFVVNVFQHVEGKRISPADSSTHKPPWHIQACMDLVAIVGPEKEPPVAGTSAHPSNDAQT